MPAYRLTFNTMDLHADGLAATLAGAQVTLGEACSPIHEFATAVLSHDYFASAHGVTQFVIRFETGSDEEAYGAAKVALDSVHLPLDGVKIERRSSRYVPVEVA